MRIVILRTSKETIGEVVRQSKYALCGALDEGKLRPGDTILIAQTVATSGGQAPIRYRMEYVRCYADRTGESKRIWGKQWPFMVEGANARPLKKPFDIRRLQVTTKNYAQGGTVVYVEPEDVEVLEKEGYLDTF